MKVILSMCNLFTSHRRIAINTAMHKMAIWSWHTVNMPHNWNCRFGTYTLLVYLWHNREWVVPPPPPQRMSKIGSCFVAAFKFPISCWWPTDPTIWPSAEEQPLTRKERPRAEMGSVRFSNLDMRLDKARAISIMQTKIFFFSGK